MPVPFKDISNLYEAEEYARGSAAAAAPKCPLAVSAYQAAAATIKTSPYFYTTQNSDASIVQWAKDLIESANAVCRGSLTTTTSSNGATTMPSVGPTGNPLETTPGVVPKSSSRVLLWLLAAGLGGWVLYDLTKGRKKRR